MKFKNFVNESFQNVSINGVLYSLNTDEKKIYTKAKESGKLMKNDLSEYDQRIANGLVTRGLLKRRKNPQHEIYFITKGRRKATLQKPIEEVAPPDSQIEKWIEDNEERFKERYGKEYKKYLYGKAWNKFNGKKMVKESVDDRPQICKDMERTVWNKGDVWKNEYNHKIYELTEITKKNEYYDGYEVSVPYYVVTNIHDKNDSRECSDYVLQRDYNLLMKADDVDYDYWDGEEDEQLNEGWHYEVDVSVQYDLPSSTTFTIDFDEDDEEECRDKLGDYVSDEVSDWAPAPIYDYEWEINNKWSDDEEEDRLDDTDKEDYWDGEDEESTQQPQINETENDIELPQYIKDLEKECTKVGDLWKNIHNHCIYEVTEIKKLIGTYNGIRIKQPVYVLQNTHNSTEMPTEIIDYVLHKHYVPVHPEEEWDGEDDDGEIIKEAKQLNEDVSYDVHVYDVDYDLPTDFFVTFTLEDDEVPHFEEYLQNQIMDYTGWSPASYNYEIENQDEVIDINRNNEDDTNNEDYWDGDDQINEVLKIAGVQLNETRISSKDLAKKIQEIIVDDTYFLDEWKQNKGTEEGFDKAIEDMSEEWAEDILGGQMFLLDRPYMDVTWARIDDLIINIDDIFQDWEAFVKEDSSSDKYITTPEWDGEDDEISESVEKDLESKYEEGDILVHNKKAREFKGDSPDKFYVKERLHPEGSNECWYVLCCIDDDGKIIRETAAFAENVIDKYFVKVGNKNDDDWDGEEDEQLDETTSAINAIRDYYTMDDNDFEWLCDYMPRTFGIMDRLSDNLGIHGEDNCKKYMIPYLEKNREKLNEYIESTKNDNYITSYLNLPSGKYFNYTNFLKFFDNDELENPSDYWDGEDDELTENQFLNRERKYKVGEILEPKPEHDNWVNPFARTADFFEIERITYAGFYDYVLKIAGSDSEDRWAASDGILDDYFIRCNEPDWDGEDEEETLNEEITPSRFWKYQESDKIDFAILSADRNERSEEENAELNKELKKDIKDMGYWYTELKGGFVEMSENGERIPVDGENSLLVPNMTREEAIDLGKKYDQDSVMFKDSKKKTLEYIITNERNGNIGDTDSSFETQAGKNNFSVSSGNDLDYYSRLHKSNKPDLKIGFNWKK